MKLSILLTVLFIGLKLGGIINWSWILVLCPIPISFILGVTLVFAVSVIVAIVEKKRKGG